MKGLVQRFEYRGGTPYGRGPAELALADNREATLVVERFQQFGPIPAGVTLYRKRSSVRPGWTWHVLPDPEGKDEINIYPGAVYSIPVDLWRKINQSVG